MPLGVYNWAHTEGRNIISYSSRTFIAAEGKLSSTTMSNGGWLSVINVKGRWETPTYMLVEHWELLEVQQD